MWWYYAERKTKLIVILITVGVIVAGMIIAKGDLGKAWRWWIALSAGVLFTWIMATDVLEDFGIIKKFIALGILFFGVMFIQGIDSAPTRVKTHIVQTPTPFRTTSSDLAGQNLENANMQRVNLEEVNLQGANLVRANLQGADLRGANLQGADLQGGDLRGANLQEADLTSASFREANLGSAILIFATFPDGKAWSPNSSIMRFTDPNHPDFWRSDDPNSPAYGGKASEE